jgi:hypothetical protein
MQIPNDKRLILVELNEVNLDFARAYAERDNLVHLKRILSDGVQRTRSESNYDELEPWIQWVSAHTGKTAAEHGIFRLGDIVGSNIPQFFEQVEAGGYTVGCVSAMNAENRLKNPAYFIPDPWTVTPADQSFWSKALATAISQAVNDNAEARLTGKSMLTLLGGLLCFSRLSNYLRYLKLAMQSRGAPWRKALFLDLFLHDLHLRLFRKKRPHFSTIFLNAGAYIQHHYFFNATEAVKAKVHNPDWYISSHQDPFAEMLAMYDRILGEYLAMDNADLIVATGLTQKPYDRVKYYWRLKDHQNFLRLAGVNFRAVYPRMTRDFLVEFDSADEAVLAAKKLSDLICETDGIPIFEKIDNRGTSLFVTLTYPGAIDGELIVKQGTNRFDLKPHMVFVAIKNGMHAADGFIYYKGGLASHAACDGQHIKELYTTVVSYFGLESARLNSVTQLR